MTDPNGNWVGIGWWVDELGVCRRTVERYAETGVIPPPVRFNRLLRWRLETAKKHLERMEKHATATVG